MLNNILKIFTPKIARRYTVKLVNEETGSRLFARVDVDAHGGRWSGKHRCFLFTQGQAEWYCYVRNNNNKLPSHIRTYTERVI